MISDVVTWLASGLFSLLSLLLRLLPSFAWPDLGAALEGADLPEHALGWLNWVLPVGRMVDVTLAFFAAVVGYSVWLAVTGWVRAVATK